MITRGAVPRVTNKTNTIMFSKLLRKIFGPRRVSSIVSDIQAKVTELRQIEQHHSDRADALVDRIGAHREAQSHADRVASKLENLLS